MRELEMKARAAVNGFRDRAAAEGVEIETYIRQGEPHQAITELAAELDATMIVMNTHGKVGLQRLLMGCVTQRTIGYSECPVLVVHS